MNVGDVYPDDMNPNLSDEQLEKLLAGRLDQNLTDHPVAAALTGGMETLRNLPDATPNQALSEFVGVMSIPPNPIASPPAQVFDLRPRPARKRKAKMISSLTALVATTTGKLALGAAVAAAAVGSAQVTGALDVVPDTGDNVEVVAAGPASDESQMPIAPIPDAGPQASPEVGELDVTDDEESSEGNGSTLNQELIFPIDGVGSVTVVAVDGAVTMTADADAGWTLMADDDGDDDSDDYDDYDEAEVEFTNGTRDVKVEAEIEHGVLRITVKENGGEVETFFDEDGIKIDKLADDDDDESDEDDDADEPDDDDGDDGDESDDDKDDESEDDDDDDDGDESDDDDDDESDDDDDDDDDD